MTESDARSSSENFAGSSASVLFDLLRGLAALLVVGGHWRHVLYVDYPEVTAYRRLVALPYLLASAGHEAVIVFFVLSGYFVGGSLFRAAGKRESGGWSDYLLRRFARLWIVLVPALLLGLFWDRLGISLGHAPGLYLGKVPNQLLPYDVGAYLSPLTFVGNLFFLQTIAVHALGSNGALWSLANEFWYYILFPLGYFALRPVGAWRERAVCGLLFAGAAYLVGGEILALFSYLDGWGGTGYRSQARLQRSCQPMAAGNCGDSLCSVAYFFIPKDRRASLEARLPSYSGYSPLSVDTAGRQKGIAMRDRCPSARRGRWRGSPTRCTPCILRCLFFWRPWLKAKTAGCRLRRN